MDPIDVLTRYPLFRVLGKRFLEAWIKVGRQAVFQPGQTLLAEGKKGTHVCVLLDGRVRLSRIADGGRERMLGVLEENTAFGEYALLTPGLNTATCRAAEDVRVYLLSLAILKTGMQAVSGLAEHTKEWLRLQALVHQLRHSAGLCFLSGPSLINLFDRCQEMKFQAGHTLQAQGLLNDGWLYIQDGEVLLEAKESALRLRTGDCFGETALLGEARLPTAIATRDTVCWYLGRDVFQGVHRPNTIQTFQPQPAPRQWDWVAQRSPSDCGVAALTMALLASGRHVIFEDLSSQVALQPGGLSFLELVQLAQSLGIRTMAVRIAPPQLAHAELPAIAHQVSGHFVTIFEAANDQLVVGDPASGIVSVPAKSFCRTWSGNLLLIEKTGSAHGS